MDRRSFFKVITGFVVAIFVPKAKATEIPKRKGAKFITELAKGEWTLVTQRFEIPRSERKRLEFDCGEIPTQLRGRIDMEKYKALCRKYTRENQARPT